MGFNSGFKGLNKLNVSAKILSTFFYTNQRKNTKSSQLTNGRPARPRPTALLSPSSDGKPGAATAVVAAPDDGHEDARNVLSCI